MGNRDGQELAESYLVGIMEFGGTGKMFNILCHLVCPLVHVVKLFCGMSQVDSLHSSLALTSHLDSNNRIAFHQMTIWTGPAYIFLNAL